jgi:transcriptional regulator with XRE-family HTH domain
MAISLDEVLDALPPDRRAEIVKRGNEVIEEYLTLQELRKKLNLTQETMAELLSIRQANVSKVEKRADMLISTLRGYLEAMGGTLELIARVPGHAPVRLEGLGDLSIQCPC